MLPRDTAIVMVSYHTGPVLPLAIDAALQQKDCTELLIVNNGNPPHVVSLLEMMAAKEPRMKLISGQGNVGFAAACNLGAQAAKSHFLLLLNPDCLLAPDALSEAITAMNFFHNATLAGALLLNPDGSEQRASRRNLMTPVNALLESLRLHRFFPSQRLNLHGTQLLPEPHAVPAISGAFMLLRREEYFQLGGLDEKYFLHVEDMDLCLRIARRGGTTICVPSARVVHLRSTSDAPSFAVELHKTRGFIRYFTEHYTGITSAPVLLLAKLASWLRLIARTVLSPLKAPREDMAARQLLLLHQYVRGMIPDARFTSKQVLVTGPLGQIGLCIIGRLLASGAVVHALSRARSLPFEHPNLHWLTMERLKKDASKSELLFHTAPLWSLPSLMERFAQIGIKKIVAFGSTSVFTKQDSDAEYERDVALKLQQAEIQLEQRAASHNIDWIILRPTLVYGVGLDANVTRIANFICRFHFFPIFPPASGLRQPVHADDLAQAALDAAMSEKAENRAYNVGGGESLSYRAMVQRVFKALGKRPRLWRMRLLPYALTLLGKLPGQAMHGAIAARMNEDLVFDISRARDDFGYTPRKFLAAGKADIGLS